MEKLNQKDFENSTLPWIGKTGKMIFVYMVDKFKQYGLKLSLEQYIILKILHEEDGQPQNNMALVTDRHKATLTRLLDTMEKNHLVVRIPDPTDKRVKRVYLTKYGRQQFESVLPLIQEATNEVQKGLTKLEINTLISILIKVQDNINY